MPSSKSNDKDFSDTKYLTKKEKAYRRKLYKRPPKNKKASIIYHSQTPQPNYSEFKKPEFIEIPNGRQYKIARGKDAQIFIDNGTISNPAPKTFSLDTKFNYGNQVLWIRIPINTKKKVLFPNPGRDTLTLYHINTQVICNCSVEKEFNKPRAATGYVIVKGFTSNGQVADPSEYEYLITDKQQKKK